MFYLIDSSGPITVAPSLIASFETFEAAEAHARATYKILDFEVDEDPRFPGCATFITMAMQIYTIEPAARHPNIRPRLV